MIADSRGRAGTNYRRRPEPELFLNFPRLTLWAETFHGEVLAFQPSEQPARLRAEHGWTHVFRRQGNEIACIPLAPDAPTIGTPVTSWTCQSAGLLRRIVQEAIIRSLTGWGCKLLFFDPPQFVARQPNRGLLDRMAGDLAGIHVGRGAQHWR